MLDLSSLGDLVKSSPVLVGGAGLGVAGTLFASLRQVPSQIGRYLRRQFVVTIDVQSTERLYYSLKVWLDAQPYTKKSRDLTATTFYRPAPEGILGDSDGEYEALAFTPAPGVPHVFRWKGHWLWMVRERKEPNMSGTTQEDISISMVGRDGTVLRGLFEEALAFARKRKDGMTTIFLQEGNTWDDFLKKLPRPLDSVVLDPVVKNRIIADLDSFATRRKWYTERGIPYRRGYLFHGPPGNGKSSIADAIAGHLRRDLYVLSLAGRDMDDQTLMQLIGRVPSTGVLLIEDVDSAFDQRETKDEHASQVTFSGLLNALDGVGSRDGLVVIMSTNHPERLDPALKRPGRVDLDIELGNATQGQAEELFNRFHPGHTVEALAFGKKVYMNQEEVSMATLQNHLVTNVSIQDALDAPLASQV